MRIDFSRLVIVITGASSGIGRATALAFARRGSSVLLGARRLEMIEEVRNECLALGGRACAVQTDVTDEVQVARLAAEAIDRFGQIDIWFNNAGVGVFGKLEQIPTGVWQRIIETNVFGYFHGAKAAMAVFKRQGRGVLINNSSIVGRIAKPDSTAYATSKFAVRGFSEALRQELLDTPDIHVCSILPSVIDTPFFEHAANFSGKRVRAAPPVYAPEKVAETVMRLVEHPRAEVIVGGAGKIASLEKRLAPALMTRVFGRALHRGFLAKDPAPPSSGIAFVPADDGLRISGGWRKGVNNGGVPTAAVLAAAVPIGFLLYRQLSSRREISGRA